MSHKSAPVFCSGQNKMCILMLDITKLWKKYCVCEKNYFILFFGVCVIMSNYSIQFIKFFLIKFIVIVSNGSFSKWNAALMCQTTEFFFVDHSGMRKKLRALQSKDLLDTNRNNKFSLSPGRIKWLKIGIMNWGGIVLLGKNMSFE